MVEAKVNPRDIDQVQVGQAAMLRFPDVQHAHHAGNQGHGHAASRPTPPPTSAPGRATTPSASPCRRRKSSSSARASSCIPGMPVEAFVQTGERTVISYLTKPLARSIHAGVPRKMTRAPQPGASGAFAMSWLVAVWRKRFGLARALALALLFALVALRIADPLPLEELRLRGLRPLTRCCARASPSSGRSSSSTSTRRASRRSANGRGRARASPTWSTS